jgi:hypothetical protein
MGIFYIFPASSTSLVLYGSKYSSCRKILFIPPIEKFRWCIFTLGATPRKGRGDSMDSSASSWGVDAFYILTNEHDSEVHTNSIHVFRTHPWIICCNIYLQSPRTRNTFTFIGPCIAIYSYNKSQRDALFLKFILVKNSTRFRQIYCP